MALPRRWRGGCGADAAPSVIPDPLCHASPTGERNPRWYAGEMAGRPTGTVTFLFTDIEGSTRLLNALGRDGYRTALEDHRSIVRDAVARHEGHEVDTQGDSFLIAFRHPSDAVRAAEEVQRGLASHEWPNDTPVRLRMGIHTADVSETGKGYVGMGVHRGARITSRSE